MSYYRPQLQNSTVHSIDSACSHPQFYEVMFLHISRCKKCNNQTACSLDPCIHSFHYTLYSKQLQLTIKKSLIYHIKSTATAKLKVHKKGKQKLFRIKKNMQSYLFTCCTSKSLVFVLVFDAMLSNLRIQKDLCNGLLCPFFLSLKFLKRMHLKTPLETTHISCRGLILTFFRQQCYFV